MTSPRLVPGLWLPSGVEIDTSDGHQMQFAPIAEDHFESSRSWVHSLLSERLGLRLKVEKGGTRSTNKRNKFFDMLFASTITDFPDMFGELEPGLEPMFADLIVVRVDGRPLPREYLVCLLDHLEHVVPKLKQELQEAKRMGEEAFASCKVLVDQRLSRRTMAMLFQDMVKTDAARGYER